LDISGVICLGILIGCIGLFRCVTKFNQTDEDDNNYSKESYQEKCPQVSIPEKSLSSYSGSFLLSSSGSEGGDEDEFTITNSSIGHIEEERELYENDWNLFTSLTSLFSSENDPEETLEENLESVFDVFNVFDPEEEEEQSFVFTESDDE
jgi:hypothetical protein